MERSILVSAKGRGHLINLLHLAMRCRSSLGKKEAPRMRGFLELNSEKPARYLHCVGTYFVWTEPAAGAAPTSAVAVTTPADVQTQSILPERPDASATLLM